MSKLKEKQENIKSKFDSNKFYSIKEAVEVIKTIESSKFDETIDISVQLGIDPKKSDEQIKYAIMPPHSLGKTIKVLAICNGDYQKIATDAGADIVGGEEIIDKILNESWVDFDVVISIPELMPKVGKLGKILGPKGIMPSPKMGTVTKDIEKAVKESKQGRIEIKNDKLGLANFPAAKKSFDSSSILDNIYHLMNSLNLSKPSSSKGVFMKKVTISSTMGPGLKIDLSSLKDEIKSGVQQ